MLTILHLTDLHFLSDRDSVSDLVQLVRLLEFENVDLVLLGGDFEDAESAVNVIDMLDHYLKPIKICYILGNRDMYSDLPSTTAINIDSTLYTLHSRRGTITICGIARNVVIRPRQYKRTIGEYARIIEHLVKAVQKVGKLDILLLHDVPLEIAVKAREMGLIDQYNEKIVTTVSTGIRKLAPTIVYTGHLHVEHIHAKIVDTKTSIFLTCWTQYRTFTITKIDTENEKVQVQVLKYKNRKITTIDTVHIPYTKTDKTKKQEQKHK